MVNKPAKIKEDKLKRDANNTWDKTADTNIISKM